MAAIFVSHSSRDREITAVVKTWLNEHGWEAVFVDFDDHDGIPIGVDWEKNLYHQMRICAAVVTVSSENFKSSLWCCAEIALARCFGKLIITLQAEDSLPPYPLSEVQVLPWPAPHDQNDLKRLDQALRDRLDEREFFAIDSDRSPYPGATAFEAADAALYFGRDEEIASALELLATISQVGGARFVLVLGPSGSGKSSFVRAGLVPRLRLRRRSSEWIVADPFRPLDRPFKQLAAALWALAPAGHPDADSLAAELREKGRTVELWTRLTKAIRDRAGHQRAAILLVVDQLEEALSNRLAEKERDDFLATLRTATEVEDESRLIVMTTLRSDFLGAFQTNARAVKSREITLGPLDEEAFAEIIEKPAEKFDVRFEPGLVERMVGEVEQRDALPLLAFTLRYLWENEARRTGSFTLAHYDSLGGFMGCLEKVAEAATSSLTTDQQKRIQRVLGGFVRIGDKEKFTRIAVPREELPADLQPAFEGLLKGRLLVHGEKERTIELAHDMLSEHWPLLRDWLDADIEFHLWRRRLTKAIEGGSGLQGDALKEADRQLRKRGEDLTAEEKTFIRHWRGVRRARLGLVAAAALVLVAVSAVAFRQWQNRQRGERLLAINQGANSALRSIARDPSTALRDAYEAAKKVFAGHFEAEGSHAEYALREALQAFRDARRFGADVVGTTLDTAASRILTASGSGNGGVALWDPDGNRLRVFAAKPGMDFTACLGSSAQDSVFAFSGRTGWAWQRESGAEKWQRTLEEPVLAHACNPVSDAVAVAGAESVVVLGSDGMHETNAPTALSRFPILIWNRDGTKLALVGDDRRVHYWTPGEPQWTSSGEAHSGDVTAALFASDDGFFLTSSSDGTLALWSLAGERLTVLPHPDAEATFRAVAISADDRWIAAGDPRGAVLLWERASDDRKPPSWHLRRALYGHENIVNDLQFSPGGRFLASAGNDGRAIVSEVDTGDTVSVFTSPSRNPVRSVRFDQRGRLILSDSEVHVIRANVDTHPIRHACTVRKVAWDPDGDLLASGCSDGTVTLWRTKSGEPLGRPYTRESRREVTALAISAAHTLVAGYDDGMLRLWRGIDGPTAPGASDIAPPSDGDFVRSIAFQGKTNRFFVASDERGLTFWDTGRDRPDSFAAAQGLPIELVTFNRDGMIMATADETGQIALWKSASQEKEKQWKAHDGPIYALAFRPGKDTLISGGDDGLRQWDMQGNAVSADGYSGRPVRDLSLRGSDDTVAVANSDLIRLFNGDWSHQRMSFDGFDASFSPDGSRLATWKGKDVRVYDSASFAPFDELFALAAAPVALATSQNDAIPK